MTSAAIGSTASSYQILAKLAAGGMAEIFLARGAGLAGVERYVVLKRILPARATDLHFVQMFLDEARLAAQLQHPNIAQVYDIGKLDDSYFFTMEYVHGETVRALLAQCFDRHLQLPVAAVLAIVAQTAAGLQHAHARIGANGRPLEIVHRDVSPSNLIVSFEGHVKVVDFGVAKAADRVSATRAGTVKGKISYLSPEQCRSLPVDRRSDLFGLGIVMWEMLAGERLYRRESELANMTAIVTEPPLRPSTLRPDVTPAVEAVVMKLLAKEADDRYQSAAELVEAIEDAALASQLTLSSSALARLLRDLFGVRPEPWIELREEVRATEPFAPVTVTSEPIPAELVALAPSPYRTQQLASVPDLSLRNLPQTGPAPVASPIAVTLRDGAQPATQLAPAKPRPMWPIVVMIAIAAALGGSAVWLATRSTDKPAAAAIAFVVIDAAPQPIDAAILVSPDAPAIDAPDPVELALEAAAHAALVDAPPAIADLVASGAYDDAARACSATAAMTEELAPSCTLAACKLGLATAARNWLTSIPRPKRAPILAACTRNGIHL